MSYTLVEFHNHNNKLVINHYMVQQLINYMKESTELDDYEFWDQILLGL